MEGTLDVWEGIMCGWKSHFVTLFNDLLILSEHKGGAVTQKIKVIEAKLDPKSDKESKFCLTAGKNAWEFNAKDVREKLRWIAAM